MPLERLFTVLGSISALTAVAAGAFGAHALRASLSQEMLSTFETAARYQMYHALALLFVGLTLARGPSGQIAAAGWLFLAGTVLFCGSLYILALSGIRAWGAVTPFGGLCFLAGWLALAWGLLTSRS